MMETGRFVQASAEILSLHVWSFEVQLLCVVPPFPSARKPQNEQLLY